MIKPIDVELYSLREYCEKDFPGTLKRVADIGFKAVEPAGLWNREPAEVKKMLDDLGLKIFTDHSVGGKAEESGRTAEKLHALGLNNVCTGFWQDAFADEDAIKRSADQTNTLIEAYKKYDITVYQHNHYWEFGRLPDGRLKYDVYDALCPDLKYQLDCFWSTNRGIEDPVAILMKYAPKCISIHIKDGKCYPDPNGGEPKVDLMPLGTGDLPIPELVKLIPDSVLSIIVELDYANIDMWDAITQSYHYMTSNGFAAGNK